MVDVKPLMCGAIGTVVGTGIGWILGQRAVPQKPPQKSERTETASFTKHPAVKYGVPMGQNLRFFDTYVASFDYRTRNPHWVIEHLDGSTRSGTASRDNSNFVEDEAIPPHLRNRLDQFRNSGYDRGHMAPAANHKSSQKALNETFCLTNISPQVGQGFNRTYWARFEKFVRDLAGSGSDSVVVVTGPLFLPSWSKADGWHQHHRMLGQPPAMMAVPTHYYKVVLAEYPASTPFGSPQHAIGAFVMPNADIDPAIPLARWAVPIEDLEAAAGVTFFTTWLTPDRRRHLATVDRTAMKRLTPSQGQVAETANHFLTDGNPKGRGRAEGAASDVDIVHLCDRVKCEMVGDDWLKSFDKKKKNREEVKLLPPPRKE